MQNLPLTDQRAGSDGYQLPQLMPFTGGALFQAVRPGGLLALNRDDQPRNVPTPRRLDVVMTIVIATLPG
jgi:hypothetical protein